MVKKCGSGQPIYPRVYGCPQPEADSAMSSWVMLVAAAKRAPVREILRAWNYRISDAYAADICRHIPPLSAMAITSFVSPWYLAELHWSGRSLLADPAFACLTTHGNGSSIHRYCPLCLRHDRIPYLRLSWRVAFQLVCPDHHCLLLEKCPSCRKRLDYSVFLTVRPALGVDAFFRFCPHCQADLGVSPVILPEERLLDHLLKAQQQLWQLIRNPFFRHPKLGTVASAKIFQSFLDDSSGDQSILVELGIVYRGINFRRLLMQHFMDAVEFFSEHPCLPALAAQDASTSAKSAGRKSRYTGK